MKQDFIPISTPALEGNELAYLADCVHTGWVSSRGAYVPRFEAGFAAWCGARHAIAVSSGTAALHLALLALGIGPGDQVILPALTYVATANAIAYTGAEPLFVDIDPETWNIDLDLLEAKITRRTRAILPVHLYGHPVDMDRLLSIAAAHELWVIEDACEAHGAQVRGRRVGGMGHIGCFSFYGNKIITTGEGGMLVSDDAALIHKARLLHNQAAKTGNTYWHNQIGFNYRMTNLQAAVGLAQLERVEQFLAARQAVQERYDACLQGVPGLTFYQEPAWGASACWLYSILLDESRGPRPAEMIDHLEQHGIESKPFFPPVPYLPAYQDGERFPAAECISRRGLSLPTSVTLRAEQIERIAAVVREKMTI